MNYISETNDIPMSTEEFDHQSSTKSILAIVDKIFERNPPPPPQIPMLFSTITLFNIYGSGVIICPDRNVTYSRFLFEIWRREG